MMTTFAEELKNAREKAGLSREELGYAIGTNRNLIYKYENDMHIPGKPRMIKLARACDVPAERFLQYARTNNRKTPGRKSILTADVVDRLLGENKDSASLGQLLKTIRTNHGLNIQEMAMSIGVSYSTYNDYEKNKHLPNPKALKTISTQYGIAMTELLAWIPRTRKGYEALRVHELTLDHQHADGQETEHGILEEFNALNPEGQAKILAYARDLRSIDRYNAA